MQILEMIYSDLEQVAVLGHQVVGWIQVNKEAQSILSEPRVEVSALVVDESYRGHGIGKALLVAAERWAIENQLLLVRIRSNLIRSDAHQFYQKQGYSVKKSWHLFTKSLSNEGI